MSSRKYTKTKRAAQESQTRERIVKAVVALHEEVGPANTSIKAVAEKAGVQRLTVYRYFPDDTSLFQACSSHWLSLNPPPDTAKWADIEEADARCVAAFRAFYVYYQQTEKMWTSIYRDVESISALKKIMQQFEAYLDHVRDDLLVHWKAKGKTRQQLSITLRHCLKFTTWQSLKQEKLKDTQLVDLVMNWIRCL